MNADQVIEGIGRAVAAANPAQEYCLFYWNVWPMCMTKAEWSGWAQAIGVFIALLLPFWNARRVRRRSLRVAIGIVIDVRLMLSDIQSAIFNLSLLDSKLGRSDLQECISLVDVRKPRSEVLSALNKYDEMLFLRMDSSVDELAKTIERCRAVILDELETDLEFLRDVCVKHLELEGEVFKKIVDQLEDLELAMYASKYFPKLSLAGRLKFCWQRLWL